MPVAAFVAIVWCSTSKENQNLKNKLNIGISHSSGKVFNKPAFSLGFLSFDPDSASQFAELREVTPDRRTFRSLLEI